jgi:hypothetical protein
MVKVRDYPKPWLARIPVSSPGTVYNVTKFIEEVRIAYYLDEMQKPRRVP